MRVRTIFAAALLAACSSDPAPADQAGTGLTDTSRPEAGTTDASADVVADPDGSDVADPEDDADPDGSDVADPEDDAENPEPDSELVDAEVESDAAVDPDTNDTALDVAPDRVDAEPDASDDIVDAEDTTDLDAADLEPDAAGLTLSEILTLLRAGGEDAAYALARSDGWPIDLEDGYLIVSFDSSSTGVAGDFSEWAILGLEVDAGFSYLVVSGVAGDGYKLTNGAQYWSDPLARSYVFDEFGELSKIEPSGGHFDRWQRVTDGVVAPRQVNVRVPASPATHVLYAHDGQNLFDGSRASFGVSWDLDASTPDGVLVIGIDHGPDRIYEYTWIEDDLRGTTAGGGGDAYADFVQSYLRPMIDFAYGEPPNVGVIGSSLGGLISLYIAHRFPGEFDMAISLSGTLGWGSFGSHQQTVLELYQEAGLRSTRLYVDSGGGVAGECVDSDTDGILDDNASGADNYCTNRQFADAMADLGYEWTVNLWHWWEPDAPHSEAAWAARVFRPLGYFVE
ncbi:MAG: hypothetical protein ACJAYU_002087 [Bradymonadia bacterium]|jgi:hypothetical protein